MNIQIEALQQNKDLIRLKKAQLKQIKGGGKWSFANTNNIRRIWKHHNKLNWLVKIFLVISQKQILRRQITNGNKQP